MTVRARQSASEERAAVNRQNRWEKVRPLLMHRFGLIIVILAVVLGGLNMLRLAPNARVESLNEPAASYVLHSQSTYQEAAERALSSSLLNGNKFTISTSHVEQQLMDEFPELSHVHIAIPLVGHRPIVYLRASEPVLLLATPGGQTYLVDENGRALATATQIRHLATLNLPVVHDESGISVDVGKPVLSRATALFIDEVVSQFAAKQIAVAQYKLPAGTSELDVYPEGKPYYVKFNFQHDTAVQQAGTYFAVAQNLESKGITPAEYVDVRIDGRAYYK